MIFSRKMPSIRSLVERIETFSNSKTHQSKPGRWRTNAGKTVICSTTIHVILIHILYRISPKKGFATAINLSNDKPHPSNYSATVYRARLRLRRQIPTSQTSEYYSRNAPRVGEIRTILSFSCSATTPRKVQLQSSPFGRSPRHLFTRLIPNRPLATLGREGGWEGTGDE